MASITVQRPDLFPDGTSVAAYPATVFGVPASGAPFGSATQTVAAASGQVAFDALAAGTSYVLYAAPNRYLRVNTSETESTGGGTGDVTESELTSAISTHSADTTSVHGIADTSALATTASVSSAITTHNNDETVVHGIPNTALLPLVNVFSTTWPARPDATIVFWVGGDASADDPSASMAVGDVWFPHSE